ncbi:hypothetical protein ES703_107813 [subsurface metagenome]
MFFEGDYVKVKNKEGYEGLIGKILAYRPPYEIQLLESKKIIYCFENEIQKISKDKINKQKRDELSENIKDLIIKFESKKSYNKQIELVYEDLKKFQDKYPFAKYPNKIEDLRVTDLYKEISNEMGEFFHWIEYKLKGLGSLNLYANVYRNASKQLDDFKELLYDIVDETVSLADKIDAQWDKISGMGGDKILAKKIVCCFNDNLIPIFNTKHLEHFFDCVIGKENYPEDYKLMSLGGQYEFLMNKLMNFKNVIPETRDWKTLKLSIFLYENYPPPGKEKWN